MPSTAAPGTPINLGFPPENPAAVAGPTGRAEARRDDRRSKDRIRLADVSEKPSAELLADLKRKIDAADDRLANALARGSSGLEISHAEIDRARLSIAEKALERVGSTERAQNVSKDNYRAGANKCNLFVYDTLKEVEADPPLANGGAFFNWFGQGVPIYPVLAGQWADPDFDIAGWAAVEGRPQVGDVLAKRSRGGFLLGFTGHVAVFVGYEGNEGRSVSGREKAVVFENWPFDRPDKTYTVRRYRGVRTP